MSKQRFRYTLSNCAGKFYPEKSIGVTTIIANAVLANSKDVIVALVVAWLEI